MAEHDPFENVSGWSGFSSGVELSWSDVADDAVMRALGAGKRRAVQLGWAVDDTVPDGWVAQ